ncbi:hypothetical protein Cgig2_017156 [Carnegiea gigantea]|uniref:Uncharacterized protein n=1 Tax=Carnegiea gigantea TaxID=171969 RepID=A0A9Q1JKA8_9CARY|nr:hypothetical protein Cgig2_017156 [Carnegiea gigantea]
MSRKPKIRHRKVKGFNNQMSPKALWQRIENLNNKQKEAVREIGFEGFLNLQADMILRKLALWLVQNFGTYSCSLSLTHGRIRVTQYDVQMMLGLLKGPIEVVEPKNESNVGVEFWPEHDSIPKCEEVIEMMQGQVDVGKDVKRNFIMLVVSVCLRDKQKEELCYLDHVDSKLWSIPHQFSMLARGYLEDTLNKMTVTNDEEEVNEEEFCSKNDEHEAEAEDETRVSKVKLIPGACTPFKRVRRVDVESMSDALISDRLNKPKCRSSILSQASMNQKVLDGD